MHYIKIGNGDTVSVSNDAGPNDWKIADNRAKRNSLLADSDSMVLQDRLPEAKVNEWKEYRKKLRDMDFSGLEKIVFPTKPE